jgi:hypothetical protein
VAGIRQRLGQALCGAALAAALGATPSAAAVVTTFYGDDDGFGVGTTTGYFDPYDSVQGPGEAPGTDITRISNYYAAGGKPAFEPTGSFNPFSLSGSIVSAQLTVRFASFDSDYSLDGQNIIELDGLTVPSAFINGFSTLGDDEVETRSYFLDPSFFALLKDGSVSLAGTHISEADGSGAFAVDFLRLDIITGASGVPEPSTWAMMISGFFGLGAALRRSRRRASSALA